MPLTDAVQHACLEELGHQQFSIIAQHLREDLSGD